MVSETSIFRQVNARVRVLAQRFGDGREDLSYHFICLCGCAGFVQLTAAEYDACGGEVFKEGHSRPAGSVDNASASIAAEPEP